MKSPAQIAEEIVNRFAWTSNVMREGKLVGQQVVVAESIADAIQIERESLAEIRVNVEELVEQAGAVLRRINEQLAETR